jgi:hypothetical protein
MNTTSFKLVQSSPGVTAIRLVLLYYAVEKYELLALVALHADTFIVRRTGLYI